MNYITLKDLGSSGGLCSQLSIYAGLVAVARANNLKIAFSPEMIEGNDVIYPHTNETFRNSIRIFDLIDINDYEIKPNSFFNHFEDKHINFHTTTFDSTLFDLAPGINFNLVGRFDLYTYWYNTHKDEIENWDFPSKLKNEAKKRFSKIKKSFKNDNPIVSIHMS